MEKGSMIKVMVMGMAVLAIAAPTLISTMVAVSQDGFVYTYEVETELIYQDEELVASEPPRAMNLLEYAKSKGADSWELTIYYGYHDYTLYKKGKIIEQATDIYHYLGNADTLWYLCKNGVGSIFPYSTAIYLTNEHGMQSGAYDITFTCSKGVTHIEGHSENNNVLFEYDVKLDKLWVIDPRGNYITGPNDNVEFINTDDIYIIDSATVVHGDSVTMYYDDKEYTGTVEYQYETTDNPYVKKLTKVQISVEYYDKWADQWITHERTLEDRFYGTITPGELIYKEPYVSGTMSAMLFTIPVVVLLGIGMYLFARLSKSE